MGLGRDRKHHTNNMWTYLEVKGSRSKVTLRVWQVLADNSRTKRPRNTEIGRKLAHPTGNKAPVSRSKVKVTRSTNGENGSTSYLPKEKAYELETLYTDDVQRPISPISAVTSKAKGQDRTVTWCVWQVLADKSIMESLKNTKIGRVGRLTIARAPGSRSRSSGRLKLKPKVCLQTR